VPLKIVSSGPSRSFPSGHAELEAPTTARTGLVIIGAAAGRALAELADVDDHPFIAIELGMECLAQHTGLEASSRAERSVGFARFRMGDAAPTKLIELVRQPWTRIEAVAAAKSVFESAGFVVAVCADFPGRIVDRLIRPYLNAVLRRLDEQLASAEDLDATLRMGLGYPEGPLALLNRTGLAHHFDVTEALYRALGGSDFLPPRRAQVAKNRSIAG
jgi:3-hydroxybutyryl-CoA dehydrogenase